jgi:DNA-directed RNA polymerase subunit RPC12/RpoP
VEKLINFKCSKCGHDYKVADEYAGKKARCKSCENVNLIPSAALKPAQTAKVPGSGDTVAAYNNLLQELLKQEKTAPSVEMETK